MSLLQLNVLTLNVWGIPYVSSDREARITGIIDQLHSGFFDIVSLQEVWSQRDSQRIQEQLIDVLPYSHYFFSGVIGSGLLVLSKYPIIGTLFHAWSVNGYFHRIQHADWFGGKGVGLCRILIKDQVVHLYNAHLHAEYNNANDEYKTHRVIQAFDTAQFIRATRGDSTLQILAGDLNTKPQDLCYNVLLYTSKMRDCCNSTELATNESPRNSYTKARALSKNAFGIRIDHIFIRSPEHVDVNVIAYALPFPERVPNCKFSYSDHEAILATLELRPLSGPSNGDFCSADDINVCEAAVVSSTVTAATREESIRRRITVLHEAIALCETALQQLKVDRIVYYVAAGLLTFFLIAFVEYSAPAGFKTVFLLSRFLLFGVILFSVFMGSIWNYMERNGILSGKMDMEMMLRCTENIELKTHT